MEIRDVNMDFAYGGSFTESSPEAYERLILDVLLGDPPLFPRHAEVELSWQILDPIARLLGPQGQARAVRRRHLGPAVGRRDAAPRRPHLEAPVIARADRHQLRRDRRRASWRPRSRPAVPAMGMVLTLVMVVDEDEADDAMEAAPPPPTSIRRGSSA